MSGTYLLCDVAGLSTPNDALGLRPWAKKPHAYPGEALNLIARALSDGGRLPTLILIDDECPFSEEEDSERSAAMTMAGLTRLFDAHGLDQQRRPACVLYTYMKLSVAEQLTFMEFGGRDIALRQPPNPVARVIQRAHKTVGTDATSWEPPTPRLLGTDPKRRYFWEDLFPLLPLMADNRRPEQVRRDLGLNKSVRYQRRNALAQRLNEAAANYLDDTTRRKLESLPDDARLLATADKLGLGWVEHAGLRGSDRIPWRRILPEGMCEPAPLELATNRMRALRPRWYVDDADPRRRHGGGWPFDQPDDDGERVAVR